MERMWYQNGIDGETIDADSLILQSIASFCTKGVSEDRAPYFHEMVRPLIGSIVEHLMEHMPAKPEVALTLWLSGRLQMPRQLVSIIGKWAETGIVEGLLHDDNINVVRRSSTKSVKLKSALKECAIITPNGTHLCDEEERLRNSIPPLVQEERYRLISDVPIFQNLPEADLHAIANACDLALFLDGEEVLKHGSAGQGMHIVVKGQGKVFVSAEVGVVTSGDVFGETAMLQGVPSTECVEACGGPLTTFHLPSLAFRALGLKKKIGNMHRKKGLKARDATFSCKDRRSSYQGDVTVAETEEDRGMVCDAIRRNENLREVLSLTEGQIEHVAREAYVSHFATGETVFEKGSLGHRFYIVQEGIFEVSDGQMQLESMKSSVLHLRTGDSFGELALLYNAPRSATVTCKKSGSCWVIARNTFKNCMWMKMEGRISEYAELIRSVDIFQDKVTPNSLANLCNALEERYFINGETIVEQGAPADSFFVIFEGTVSIIKDGEEIRQLGRGHYFGERALLCSDVRSATVKVASERCTVLALDRLSFNFMLMQEEPCNAASSPRSPLQKRCSRNFEGILPDDGKPIKAPTIPAAKAIIENSYRPKAEKSAKLIRTYGARVEQRQNDEPGCRNIASFVRIGFLGKGSFGSVTLEKDPMSGRFFALKAMSKQQIERDQLRDAIINERTCLGLLNSDFLVKLVSTYRDARNVYLLLEACFGGELFEVFEKNSDFFGSEAHIQFYAACVALGLEHIHGMRIIYRDLKLENCLLSLNGYLKLTDMGIAKVCIGKTYTVCGTTDYFAPETLRQTGHNRAVDWWALGVMVYIMMTGRSPFDAPDTMKIYRKIMKGFAKVTFPSEFPEQCISMIRALCQRNPEERLTMGSLGVQNFKDHPWYRGFVWKELQSLRMVAPHVPAQTEDEIVATLATKSPPPCEEHKDALRDENDEDETFNQDSGWDDVFDQFYVFSHIESDP